MKQRNFLKVAVNLLGQMVVIITTISFAACIAAIPIAIHYSKGKEGYVAEAEIPSSAEKVYRTAIALVEERAPVVSIVKKDDKKHLLELTDGIQKASLKIEPISAEKTGIIVKADIPKVEGKEKEYEQEREKELALRIIDKLCTKLNVHCSVTNK